MWLREFEFWRPRAAPGARVTGWPIETLNFRECPPCVNPNLTVLTPGVDLVHDPGADPLVAGEGRLDGRPLRAHRLVRALHVVRAVVARRRVHLKKKVQISLRR